MTELSFIVFGNTAMKTLLKETGFLKAVRTGHLGVMETSTVIHGCQGRRTERETMTTSMLEAVGAGGIAQNGLH